MNGFFCWRYNTTTFCDHIYTCLFVTHIYGLFLYAYICAFVRKWSYTWELKPNKAGKNTRIRGKKTHVYRISCSRNDCKYTCEETARISSHNFKTNGRPYSQAIFILINPRTDYDPSSDILELFLISCLKVFQFVQVLWGWGYGLFFLSYLYFIFNRVCPFPALFRLRFIVLSSLFTYVVTSISSCS